MPSAAALSADPGEQAMGIMVYRLIVVSYFILLPSYFWYRWCARAAVPPAAPCRKRRCTLRASDAALPAQAVHHRVGRAVPHVLPDHRLRR